MAVGIGTGEAVDATRVGKAAEPRLALASAGVARGNLTLHVPATQPVGSDNFER